MKSANLWDKCGLLLFFAAHESTPAAFNLKGCPHGELHGGVEHIPGRGIKGNGVDAWFDTNLHVKDIPGCGLNHHGIYIYVADDLPGSYSAIGASGGGPAIAIRPRNLSSQGLYTCAPTQVMAGPIVSGVGLGGYSRFSETQGLWIKDKTSGPLALVPAQWPNSTLRVLRHGAAGAYFPGGVSFVWAGEPLSADEAKALCGIFDEALSTLGTLKSIRVAPTPAYSGPGAFKREQIADVKPKGIKIFALALPPESDATDEKSYYYFPLTYAVCRPWTARGTSTKVKCLELMWSDRALGPKPGVISDIPFKKGNDTSGVITLKSGKGTGRTEFDSYELAIGAMLGRTAYSAGLKPFDDSRCMWEGKPMGWCDWLARWGYDVSAWRALASKSANIEKDPIFTTDDANTDTGGIIMHRAYVAARADQIFTQPALTGGTIYAKRNIVILGPGRSADDPKFAGFIMDLEHADGRSPELFAQSMEMWCHIIHCIKNPDGTNRYIASTTGHELDSGTGKLAGWDKSIGHRVYSALDYTCINVGTVNGRKVEDRFQSQLKVLQGPNGDLSVDLGKIMLQVHIGMGGDQIKMSDAVAVHEWLAAHPTLGAMFQAPVGANLKVPATDTVSRLRGTIYGLETPR